MANTYGQRTWMAALAAVATVLSACAGPPPGGPTPEALLSNNGLSVNGLSVNGLSVNGMSVNGMSVNGLSVNGLSVNGLSVNGLATAEFADWFAVDPVTTDMLMRYIVKCSLPAGQTLSYTWDGTVYTWYGVLGLAPGWGNGAAIAPAEQQLVTACLAAHSNKFGLHVGLSVRGPLSVPDPVSGGVAFIPLDPGEDTTFTKPEGCFFGNLFDGSGIYSGAFLASWAPQETNPRGCAVENDLPGYCPPIENLGSCADVCTAPAGSDPTAPVVYTSCSPDGGVSQYLPLTTYLAPSDVAFCGDGFCQFPESPTSCPEDCPAP